MRVYEACQHAQPIQTRGAFFFSDLTQISNNMVPKLTAQKYGGKYYGELKIVPTFDV